MISMAEGMHLVAKMMSNSLAKLPHLLAIASWFLQDIFDKNYNTVQEINCVS